MERGLPGRLRIRDFFLHSCRARPRFALALVGSGCDYFVSYMASAIYKRTAWSGSSVDFSAIVSDAVGPGCEPSLRLRNIAWDRLCSQTRTGCLLGICCLAETVASRCGGTRDISGAPMRGPDT